MDGKQHGNRRRTKIVMRDMQSRMIRETTLIPLVALTVFAVTVTEIGRRVIAEAAEALVELPNLDFLLIAVMLMTTLMVGSILYVAFRFTHRVAGPSYRLIESLKRMQQGDVDFQIRLRKGDFLTEVADQFNATLTALQQRQSAAANRAPESRDGETSEPAAAGAFAANSASGD